MSRQFVSPDIRGRVSSAKTPIWVSPFPLKTAILIWGACNFKKSSYINNSDTLIMRYRFINSLIKGENYD